MDEDVTKSESKTEQANSEEKKGAPILMIICAIVVIFVFIKWVFPAMNKDTRPPSSILTGEESSDATQ